MTAAGLSETPRRNDQAAAGTDDRWGLGSLEPFGRCNAVRIWQRRIQSANSPALR
jgi:hypothetical protein